jgi:hypothetical protein
MQKTRDYEHQFVNRSAVGTCRIRVYEELGERPVVVATQRHAPSGHPDPTTLVSASRRIAADLIQEGILRESYRAVTLEMLEKAVQEGDVQRFRNSAPFRFVEEYLEPRHQLSFVWFEVYYIVTEGGIGNVILREDATREEVEERIGASLDD